MKHSLESVKVGDTIVVHECNRDFEHVRKLIKVTRITKTLVVCNETRFRKSDGYPINGNCWSYWRTFAEIATPELVAEIKAETADRAKRKELQKQFNSVSWANLPTCTLEEIVQFTLAKIKDLEANDNR